MADHKQAIILGLMGVLTAAVTGTCSIMYLVVDRKLATEAEPTGVYYEGEEVYSATLESGDEVYFLIDAQSADFVPLTEQQAEAVELQQNKQSGVK